jgi:hypothetical protein
MPRPASHDTAYGEEGRRRSSRARPRKRASSPPRAPTAAERLGLGDYVESQPFTAVIAAAMTGYAIAWYLRGGRRI